jgi:hypothetical protein
MNVKLLEDLVKEMSATIERLEWREREWLRRVEKAAEVMASVEADSRYCEEIPGEDWVGISHAATILEELERDMRSDLLTAAP